MWRQRRRSLSGCPCWVPRHPKYGQLARRQTGPRPACGAPKFGCWPVSWSFTVYCGRLRESSSGVAVLVDQPTGARDRHRRGAGSARRWRPRPGSRARRAHPGSAGDPRSGSPSRGAGPGHGPRGGSAADRAAIADRSTSVRAGRGASAAALVRADGRVSTTDRHCSLAGLHREAASADPGVTDHDKCALGQVVHDLAEVG